MNVSVVVPTRNRCALLATTLKSVLGQRDVSLEVIVVDEASSDGTPELLASLGDDRVRVVRHQAPRGVSAARNCGGSEARGEWLAFVDDDDVWAPDKLARQLEAAEAADSDWAYAGAVNISPQGGVVSGRPPLPPERIVPALRRYNAVPGGGSNVVVRRTTWAQVGPFDTRLRNTEDWEMWIRLAKHGRPAWVCSPLVGYRVHRSNASLDVPDIVQGTRLIEALHQTHADWGMLHRWLAESCLRRRERRRALGHFVRAALRGELLGVVSDLNAITARRIAQPVACRQTTEAPSRNPWFAAAEGWLRDLHS